MFRKYFQNSKRRGCQEFYVDTRAVSFKYLDIRTSGYTCSLTGECVGR